MAVVFIVFNLFSVQIATFEMCLKIKKFEVSNIPILKLLFSYLNRETTHPGITKYFNDGALSIKRTEKNFSRSKHDMTLEQSVNRDAASRLTGIPAFTSNFSGRLRWNVTKSSKARTVTLLKETAGLTHKDRTAQVFPNKFRIE